MQRVPPITTSFQAALAVVSLGQLGNWYRYFTAGFGLFCLAILLSSCGQEENKGWQELNLMRYNIPLSVLAPDSAKVSTTEVSGVMRDITITEKANDYYLQVFSSQAYTQDIARIKADQLDLVRNNPYFESVVEEEPNGFIYQNRIDSSATYGFRYIVFMGDKEIIFQNGMGRMFNEAAVRKMYNAVKQKSKR